MKSFYTDIISILFNNVAADAKIQLYVNCTPYLKNGFHSLQNTINVKLTATTVNSNSGIRDSLYYIYSSHHIAAHPHWMFIDHQASLGSNNDSSSSLRLSRSCKEARIIITKIKRQKKISLVLKLEQYWVLWKSVLFTTLTSFQSFLAILQFNLCRTQITSKLIILRK